MSLVNFIRKNHILIAVGIILLIAAFLRIHRISEYLTFLGDEGRDVLVVRDILHGHFTLLGPRASAADFFTGPIYYYMMAPFLFLSNYNPVGPAIMIAVLSVITVYLIYRFGKEWFGQTPALIAAFLYAISPLVIQYSRSSWNPNPMPFFSMIMLYILYKSIPKPSIQKFILLGFLYGIAFQLHYIEIFLGITIAFYMLIANIMISKKELFLRLIKQYASFVAGFVVGVSPFLAFEARHGFPNVRTVIAFIIHGDTKPTDIGYTTLTQNVPDVFFRLFARLLMYFPEAGKIRLYDTNVIIIWTIFTIIVAVASVIALIKIKNVFVRLLFGLWLFFGVILFGFYHKAIYDYYFEFMFPLPFLLFGNLLSFISEKNRILKFVAVATFAIVLYLNFLGYPFRYPGNNQYGQVKKISEFILNKANNKPFNFALLTGGNSDHAYRYIFETEGKPPITIQYAGVDPQRKTVTDQLFVVCEDLNCKPEGSSLWEVAGFGRAKIVDEWPVSVLKVYKLEHYTGK